MATTAETAAGTRASSKQLKREIGFIGLTWASVGSIIGSGWLFGAQKALEKAGPAAIISWVIGAVVITILALVHAELGAMYPLSGGTARFPHFAFGGAAGASFGWFSWLQAATVAPIEVSAVLTYGTHYSFAQGFEHANETLTASGIGAAVVLMALFVVLNMFGIKVLANTNSAATWWKVAIPLVTIFVLGIATFHTSNFTAADGFAPGGAKGIFEAIATGGIIFALLGFEQADQLAGEAKNAQRDLPRAIIGSMILGTVVYVALQVVFIGALKGSDIPGSWLASKGGYVDFSGPFAQVASVAAIGWLATVLYIDAVISPGGTGLIYTTATSRVSYGLSRNGYFPKAFEWTTRQGVPWFGLVVSFVVGIIAFLPFPSWQSLVGLITSASVLMYAGAPLALGAFRLRLPHANRPYRVPFATVLSPLAFAVANLLILFSGWTTDWKLGVAILLGYVLLAANVIFKLNPVKADFKIGSSLWLPPYLLGMGVITFFSTFNDTKFNGGDTAPLNLYVSMLVTAVFSIGIYFWAMASALPAEEMQSLIDESIEETEHGPEIAAV